MASRRGLGGDVEGARGAGWGDWVEGARGACAQAEHLTLLRAAYGAPRRAIGGIRVQQHAEVTCRCARIGLPLISDSSTHFLEASAPSVRRARWPLGPLCRRCARLHRLHRCKHLRAKAAQIAAAMERAALWRVCHPQGKSSTKPLFQGGPSPTLFRPSYTAYTAPPLGAVRK